MAESLDLQKDQCDVDATDEPVIDLNRCDSQKVIMRGFISALKDGFGFIETMAQDDDVFFHFSSLIGDFWTLEEGQEVEYLVGSKLSPKGKSVADIVNSFLTSSTSRAEVLPEILQGVVKRPLRKANPDQSEYAGIIGDHEGHLYNFGILSILNKKEILQAGEDVEFQLDAQGKPVNIRALRKKLQATVDSFKSQFGFLSHELEDGKKLFFHRSEVKDNQQLKPGDEVEFEILQNQRTGKFFAHAVVKIIKESPRPDRLLNRIAKLSVDESASRLVVIRQPYGPDGTNGFAQPRLPHKPGSLVAARESTTSSGNFN